MVELLCLPRIDKVHSITAPLSLNTYYIVLKLINPNY